MFVCFCFCLFCKLGVVVKWNAPKKHRRYIYIYFFFDARFLIYVFATSYQLGRENKKGSGPPVIIILVIITKIIRIFLWLNNATRYFSTSLLQAVITTSLSWSRKKSTYNHGNSSNIPSYRSLPSFFLVELT